MRRTLIALAIAAGTLAAPAAAAEDCRALPLAQLFEGPRAADYVFQGTVAEQSPPYTIFNVERYFKNRQGAQLALRMPDTGPWSGRLPRGARYVVFAKRYGGVVWLDPCLQAAAVTHADTLADLLKLDG